MTNVDLIAAHIAKHGGKNMLIHIIPGTSFWLMMEKIGSDQWVVTLLNPMQRGHHRFGIISNAEHLKLWTQLVLLEIERRNRPKALGVARGPPL